MTEKSKTVVAWMGVLGVILFILLPIPKGFMTYTIIGGTLLIVVGLWASQFTGDRKKEDQLMYGYSLLQSSRGIMVGLMLLTFVIAPLLKKQFPGFESKWIGIAWGVLTLFFAFYSLLVFLGKGNNLTWKLIPPGEDPKRDRDALISGLLLATFISGVLSYLFYYLFTWL